MVCRISSLVALVAITGCHVENNFVPHFEVSPLHRLGCDDTNNAQAAPEERPVAVCDVSRTSLSPIYESTSLVGKDSFDPNGHELIDYWWHIVEAPEGSAVDMVDGSADRNGLVPDLVGRYTAELVVTNDQCVMSDPCQVVFDAVPSEDLWVEMHWQHANDDMDLHLLYNNAPYDSDRDCYYGNCIDGGLDWGVQGATIDNPRLDLDDIENMGPENVNIDLPADGLYTIAVHDFPGTEYWGDNAVTVKIHVEGELAFEETRIISGEDSRVPFADVTWPGGDLVVR